MVAEQEQKIYTVGVVMKLHISEWAARKHDYVYVYVKVS